MNYSPNQVKPPNAQGPSVTLSSRNDHKGHRRARRAPATSRTGEPALSSFTAASPPKRTRPSSSGRGGPCPLLRKSSGIERIGQITRWAGLFGTLFIAACAGPFGGPPPTPTPGVVSVGEKTETDQIALTVNSATRRELIGEASTPGPGSVFLIVDVTILNGSNHKVDYSRYQFSLTDPLGRAYDPATVPGQDHPLLTSQLEAQKDTTGTIAFRIPTSTPPGLKLTFQPPGAHNPLRVDLAV